MKTSVRAGIRSRVEQFASNLVSWRRFRGMRETVTGAGQGGFAASDAVGRYWLARCDGFEVRSPDGRLTGVVSAVELDLADRASALVVQRRRRRPLYVHPAAVALVDPWEETVVVTLPPRKPRTAHVRPAAAAAVHGAHAASAHAWETGRRLVPVARRAAPPSQRFALWLGARTAYALAFAGWLYGAVLFVVSRVATRVLLVVVREVTRLSVRVGPPLARGAGRAIRRASRLPGRINRLRHDKSHSAHGIPRRHEPARPYSQRPLESKRTASKTRT
jgi:hypothetical protein